MKITVNDANCTAHIEGLNLGTNLSVRGYDKKGNKSGYVYLDGQQVCEGFELQGTTMLYDPCETFSEYIRRQCKKSGRKYRVVVKNA
jgi:hypothetical protein